MLLLITGHFLPTAVDVVCPMSLHAISDFLIIGAQRHVRPAAGMGAVVSQADEYDAEVTARKLLALSIRERTHHQVG